MDNSSTLDIDNNSGWQLSQRMIINDNLSEYTQWMTIVFTSRDCFRKISEGKLRTISWHVLKPIFGIEWFPWLIVFTTFWKSPKIWREFQAETLLKFTWSDLPPEVRDECWPHLPRAIQLLPEVAAEACSALDLQSMRSSKGWAGWASCIYSPTESEWLKRSAEPLHSLQFTFICGCSFKLKSLDIS